ncbi:hypothetical protein MLD38_020764 [Melastoma candidum]|uniref:Uncharacterized protein n=1 Tax=Melastoma candidum TaxID=119954 RepID=A0ACB9QDH1_9MYRT|nr:hypothetical protein MLD38_020764 [Melastoma candidum]
MGSLEAGHIPKRDNPLLPRTSSSSLRSRPRSRLSRTSRVDYLQWICSMSVFLSFIIFFQLYLPGSSSGKDKGFGLKDVGVMDDYEGLVKVRELGGLDFGFDVRFRPAKFTRRFREEDLGVFNVSSSLSLPLRRFGHLKPRLAMIFGDLLVDPEKLLMVTVASALQEIGYEIQVFSLDVGPVHDVWKNLDIPVSLIESCDKTVVHVDWLSFSGIIVDSIESKGVFSCFLQEPFKSVSLLWTIHDVSLAHRLKLYNSTGQIELLNSWRKMFSRATAVIFPNYALPVVFSSYDSGNFYVIPGSPVEAWEAGHILNTYEENLREKWSIGPTDVVVAVVGSQFLYKGLWLEHALILQAMSTLLPIFPSDSSSTLKVIFLCGNTPTNYSAVLEIIAGNLRYPQGVVQYQAVDKDSDNILRMADLVIYGSFLEEQSFPGILIKAMRFGKLIIAPETCEIKRYVTDGVNGYLFPKNDFKTLRRVLVQAISKGKLSGEAEKIAANGKHGALNLMASETVEGYATLLKIILRLPSEVISPKDVTEIFPESKEGWKWRLFENVSKATYETRYFRSETFLNKVEELWNLTQRERLSSPTAVGDSFFYDIWEDERYNELAASRKRREEQELKDRSDQPHGTWEDVYKSAKKADRTKNELHEREERELERTGQPLCIYEPFLGEGIWPFLHVSSLYRGIGLSTKGRRAGADDIDAPSRLPVLNNPYYRDLLGEFGASFAIANRIDRIHKNQWIGFQSWRATARKGSLSKAAEEVLLHAIQRKRHGDALYFWVRMDEDTRNPLQQDFWSFCDAINAGNCRFAFFTALKSMYRLTQAVDSLPPMPVDGDTWSVMQSWVVPTRSFLEFVMFSRMFVDALDAHMYDEHHRSGHCYLSLSKDKHCYSRVLELLVNVWAYHSARKMVYVNPETGAMQEQHGLLTRRGKMWVKWFSYATLKSMDEDYAEEFDLDKPRKRWLWPLTGEIVWHGTIEKERSQRLQQKEKRKQQSREKIERIKKRHHFKTIGKYVKPPPEGEDDSTNATTAQAR